MDAATTTITGITGGTTRPAPIRRLLAGVALGLVVGVAALVPGQAVSAASPGNATTAQCKPASRTIDEKVEAFRSYSSEYVVLQGATVHRASGTAYYSQWFATTPGPVAEAVIYWSNMPRGSYNVYYRWAAWNAAQGRYTYSAWIHVSTMWTVGGSGGRCTI